MANKRVSVKGKGADLFFGDYTPPEPVPEEAQEPVINPTPKRSRTRQQSTARLTDRPTNRSTKQSTARSLDAVTPNPHSQIVGRPKAFYITERLNQRLDEAVVYFQRTHGLRKVDRSTVINAMLDDDEHWDQEALDLLVGRLIAQLTSRLTGR